jgi:hypothetical protein
MSSVPTEPLVVNDVETPTGALLRLWDEVEQALAAPPPVPTAPLRLRPGAAPWPRPEAREESPGRVRYAYD